MILVIMKCCSLCLSLVFLLLKRLFRFLGVVLVLMWLILRLSSLVVW